MEIRFVNQDKLNSALNEKLRSLVNFEHKFVVTVIHDLYLGYPRHQYVIYINILGEDKNNHNFTTRMMMDYISDSDDEKEKEFVDKFIKKYTECGKFMTILNLLFTKDCHKHMLKLIKRKIILKEIKK